MMKFTFHDWVLNAMTAPNATRYTKSDKYVEKHTNRDYPKPVRNRISRVVLLLFVALGKKTNDVWIVLQVQGAPRSVHLTSLCMLARSSNWLKS